MNESLRPQPPMKITDKEFKKLSSFIYDKFGIHLSEAKKPLLIVRLQKQVRQLGLTNFDDYYDHLQNDPTKKSLSDLINKISTNFTYFNRESSHFDYYHDVALKEFKNSLDLAGEKDLRVWCAGCSSGEEAYFLQMLMLDAFKDDYSKWKAGLLATDISEQVLTRAKMGVYPSLAISKLPSVYQKNYFLVKGDEAFVKENVKKEISFRRYNLLNKSPPFRKKFHIVFCRNVMIYFDNATRKEVITRFIDLLEVGGYLFIGHSETLGQGFPQMKFIIPACYRKVGDI